MARFYGSMTGQAKTTVTRRGGPASGVRAHDLHSDQRKQLACFVLSPYRLWSDFIALGAPASELRELYGLWPRKHGDYCELDPIRQSNWRVS